MLISTDAKKINATYWRYALPAIITMLADGLYHVVDGIFIGYTVGPAGLAAIHTAWPLIGLVTGVGLMIGIGTGIHCSIAQGRGLLLKAKKTVIQGLWLLIFFSLIMTLLVAYGSEHFLSWMRASDEVHAHASIWLNIMGKAAPLVMAGVVMPILVENLGAPRLATVMMITGATVNVILDYILIVKCSWGLRGAAVATITGETLSVIIGTAFLLTKYSSVPLRPLKKTLFYLQPRVCITILYNGFSSLLAYLYASFAVTIHNVALMHYGNEVNISAYAITAYLMTIYYMLAEGLAAGMQPVISYFHGAAQTRLIRKIFLLALKWAVGSGIILVILILIFPHIATSIFINVNEPVLASTAIRTARLHLCVLFLDGFLILASTYFQAIEDTRKATAITLCNMCIQIPFLLLLAPWLGVDGILLALPLSTVLLSLVIARMLKRQFSHPPESEIVNLV